MIRRKKESRFISCSCKSAKTVTCVTYYIYNIAQDKEKIKWSISIAR